MKRIAIAAAVVVSVALAYAAFGLYQRQVLRTQVAQAVDAAGARVSATLGADLAAPTAAVIQQLDRSTEDTEADLLRLRAARARSERDLVEAADAYIGNVLAVLKRQSGSARGRLGFANSRKELAEHMGKTGQRGEGWGATAIRLKDRLDGDYFEYRIAASSLGNMLGELPGTRAKIAALLPQARLPEEAAIRAAREHALAVAELTRKELEQSRQLVPR